MALYGYKPKHHKALWTGFGAGKAQSDAAAAKKAQKATQARRKPLPMFTPRPFVPTGWPSPPIAPKRKRIAVRSKRKRKEDAIYNARVAQWKLEHPVCCFPGCLSNTKDCHHTRGKVGTLLMDEQWWAPLCRHHHDWVDRNRTEARNICVRVAHDRVISLLPEYGGFNSQPRN